MSRNRASAKAAGARFERDIADYLAANVDDRIDRRVKTGSKDRGDLGGWRYAGLRIVAECKNVIKLSLGTWWAEAEIEKANDDADIALVIHKRHGRGAPQDQWVTTTLGELVNLLHATKGN
ncbi:hypothetical protein [Nocardioides sp. NPDC006273]|uniref:hypothetical protein n=1 Tax=Nocardioides sp. NPDC006273 TaxID=3155598 RepID=UPI0033A39B45